jgi:hypothetical protein
VVVVMLAGMFLPAMTKAKNESKIVGCVKNLKQMAQASLMYGQDFSGNLTANSWISSYASEAKVHSAYTDRSGADDDLNWVYPRYIDTLNTFVCPATKNKIRNSPVASALAPYGSYLPDLTDNAVNLTTSGDSYEVFGDFNAYPTESYGRKKTDKEANVHEIRTYAGHVGEIPGASAVMLIMDADDTTALPSVSPGNPYNSWPDIGNNHGSSGTCSSFCDGHAEFIPLSRYLNAWNLSQDSNATGH